MLPGCASRAAKQRCEESNAVAMQFGDGPDMKESWSPDELRALVEKQERRTVTLVEHIGAK